MPEAEYCEANEIAFIGKYRLLAGIIETTDDDHAHCISKCQSNPACKAVSASASSCIMGSEMFVGEGGHYTGDGNFAYIEFHCKGIAASE
jgi:hypothetical protein